MPHIRIGHLLNFILSKFLHLIPSHLLYLNLSNPLNIIHTYFCFKADHLFGEESRHHHCVPEEVPHPLPVALYPHLVKDGSEARVKDKVEDQIDSFRLSASERDDEDERLRQPDQEVEHTAHCVSPPPRHDGLGVETKFLSTAATEIGDNNIEKGTDDEVAQEASQRQKHEGV